jgi:dipeptidyl aminopeptidase/acylaminoacyl peptidase
LLIHGDEDDYFPTDDALDLGGSLGARVEIIEGMKHYLAPGQQPVGDLIEQWFADRL